MTSLISSPSAPVAPVAAVTPAEAITPLVRGVVVLRTLTEAGGTLSLRDLSHSTGLARSTVDRIAATLAHMGYVRLDGRDVTVLPGVMELGNAYLDATHIPEVLGPHVRELADQLDESVSLTVPDGTGLRMIHQVKHRRARIFSFGIGDLLPVERAAPGALMAADWSPETWAEWHAGPALPTIHGFPADPPGGDPRALFSPDVCTEAAQRGWAEDDQRIAGGLLALGVAVRDPCGRRVCGVSVVSHTSRHTMASLRDAALPGLQRTVARMEDALRRIPVPTSEPPVGTATWTGTSKQVIGREFVESLARGLAAITAFGSGHESLSTTGVAEATGLPRATARRVLITLEHLGYVVAEDRRYRLTPRVLELGFPPMSRTSLAQLTEPHIGALAARVQDSASMAVLEGSDIRYTARVPAYRVMSVNITVGTRFPSYATSMGRVLLAGLPPAERRDVLDRVGPLERLTGRTISDRGRLEELLDQVAEQGYALNEGELDEGLRSIAVPVHDRDRRVVAAVNVAMHTSRRTPEECTTDLLPHLRATAARIETEYATATRFVKIPVI